MSSKKILVPPVHPSKQDPDCRNGGSWGGRKTQRKKSRTTLKSFGLDLTSSLLASLTVPHATLWCSHQGAYYVRTSVKLFCPIICQISMAHFGGYVRMINAWVTPNQHTGSLKDHLNSLNPDRRPPNAISVAIPLHTLSSCQR